MNKSPAIVMSRLDVQRLEKVLDTLDGPIDLMEALEKLVEDRFGETF